MRMAEAFDFLGESNYASTLRTKAGELQAKFEKQFWCEDLGFYALALDSEKQPVRTVASNPGHCS